MLAAVLGGGWHPASRPALAAGFAAARFGAEHGTVTTTNPTALYYNPAGIAFSGGTHLYIDGTLALRHSTWERAAGPTDRPDPAGGEGANAGKAELFNVFGGPMFGATTALGDLVLGASFSVPFGGRARWDQNPRFANHPQFPLAADGVQRWHGIEGALTFMYFTAGAAYRLGRFSLGVSGNLIRSTVKSSQAKTVTGFGDADTEREGRATLDVKGMHGSFAAGAMAELVEKQLWLGASYQAQPGLGPMALKGTLTTEYQGSKAPFPVQFEQALPDVIRAGLRYRPSPSLELRLAAELTRWSVMGTQCVVLEGETCAVYPDGSDATPTGATLQNLRRHWKDSYGVRGGVSTWVRESVELYAGAGYETGAVPDETLDPGLADADNFSGAAGGRFEIARELFLSATYTHIQYRARDNRGKSRLADAELPTKRPDGGGRYTQWIGLFNLGLEKQF